jgi:hypothetical protein
VPLPVFARVLAAGILGHEGEAWRRCAEESHALPSRGKRSSVAAVRLGRLTRTKSHHPVRFLVRAVTHKSSSRARMARVVAAMLVATSLPAAIAFAPPAPATSRFALAGRHPARRAQQCASRAGPTTSVQMGFFDGLFGKPSVGAAAGGSALPPDWTEQVDPSSGETYYFNQASGESTWDRPAKAEAAAPAAAAVRALQPKRQLSGLPPVPTSYDEIHAQAIASVAQGLKAGKRRLEVEFPPIAQTNKISDGSASSQATVRRANVAFNAKVAAALSKSAARVLVLCEDAATLQEMLRAVLPSNAFCALIKDAASLGPRKGDIILSCQPANSKSWIASAQLESEAPVIVLNGFQYNGYKAFDMAYYLKPMTFNSGICGYCIRSFPYDWVVWSAKTAQPIDYSVEFVEAQGCLRPDLQRISLRLTA